MRKLEPRQCQARRVDGLRCRAFANPDSPYCTIHSKSPEERLEASHKAAQASVRVRRQRKEAEVPEDTRVPLQHGLYREVERVIRELLSAKLVGMDETDFALASVGAFLSWLLYDMPDDFESFAQRVLPRDIAARAAESEATARRELNDTLLELGFMPVEKAIDLRAEDENEKLLRMVADT